MGVGKVPESKKKKKKKRYDLVVVAATVQNLISINYNDPIN